MPLGMEVGLDPGHIMLDGAQLIPRQGAQQLAPRFRPMSIVAKRSPISATAELLFYISYLKTFMHWFMTSFFIWRTNDW